MKLSIIIVNWNTCGLLRQCLRSVRAEFDARPEWDDTFARQRFSAASCTSGDMGSATGTPPCADE